jgi:hypothetical protein
VVRNRGSYWRSAIPGSGGWLDSDRFHYRRIVGEGKFGAEPWLTPCAPPCRWPGGYVVSCGGGTPTSHLRCETLSKFSCPDWLSDGLSKLTVSSHHILTRRRMLLAQAEQAAHDLAQAEADMRALSTISPIVPGKRAIMVLGGASIGALIVASDLGKGPLPVAPGQMAQQVQPPQIQPPVTSPVPPVRPTFRPHVEKDASGQLRPEDGFDWSDGTHESVRWILGKVSRQYPHVIASDTEGKWEPDDGYD